MTTTENNVAAQAGDEPMPCPFCGGAPQVDNEHDDRGNRVIECAGCGANVGANMLSAGWRRWNQRVSPRATADVERVRDLIAAEVANNWPMRKYSLEEIEIKLGEIDIARLATTKPGA